MRAGGELGAAGGAEADKFRQGLQGRDGDWVTAPEVRERDGAEEDENAVLNGGGLQGQCQHPMRAPGRDRPPEPHNCQGHILAPPAGDAALHPPPLRLPALLHPQAGAHHLPLRPWRGSHPLHLTQQSLRQARQLHGQVRGLRRLQNRQ